jgi:Protein of unknown function (DUF3443)
MKALGLHAGWRRVLLVGLTVLVSACGGGGGGGNSTATVPSVTGSGANTLAVTVDAGPAGSGNNVNRLYTKVTVCPAGSTTQCQTIDHVLVDTGSTGLRLLASVLNSPAAFPPMLASGGQPLLNCDQFLDNSYAWGPVTSADVTLGGMTARSVPIQIMGSTTLPTSADQCQPGGIELSTVNALRANGILGMGLFQQDCHLSDCVSNPGNGFYYTCTDASCTASVGTTAVLASQLTNPVVRFATDNNGFLITLPSVPPPGAASVNGVLVFGIDTQSNNQFTAGSVLTTNALGNITTRWGSQTWTHSFIDSGSNGLYFDSRTLTTCPVTGGVKDFYCPASSQSFPSVTLTGTNAVSASVSFAVDNAQTIANSGNKVLPTLAGPILDSRIFDWGLPFFYGRSVFYGIDQTTSTLGAGPLMAF